MQLAGQVEADFVNQARQVHPAAHGFTRAAGIDDVAHAGNIEAQGGFVNQGCAARVP